MTPKNKTVHITQGQIDYARDKGWLWLPSKCPLAMAVRAAGFSGALAAPWGIIYQDHWMPCTPAMKRLQNDHHPIQFETEWRPRKPWLTTR